MAIVLADSEEHADYAAKHGVAVEYSGEKKPVVSIDQAIAAGGEYLTHDAMDRETKKMTPMGTQRGDVAAAEAKAAHTAEGVVYASGQYHFHIETQSVVAVPMEDDGLRLHSATQCASTVQTAVAAAIGVQQNKVIVETKRW